MQLNPFFGLVYKSFNKRIIFFRIVLCICLLVNGELAYFYLYLVYYIAGDLWRQYAKIVGNNYEDDAKQETPLVLSKIFVNGF